MLRVTLTVAPGIWRDPSWIVDEFERLLRRGYCQTLRGAVAKLCARQGWTGTVAATDGGAVVALFPIRSAHRYYTGFIDCEAPVGAV